MIWEEVISKAMNLMVEGYSRAKKVKKHFHSQIHDYQCSNSGRILMSLDLQNFTNGLNKLTHLR